VVAFRCALLCLLGLPLAAASAKPLPPLHGEIRGEWAVPVEGGPVLPWRASVKPDEAGNLELTLEVDDQGLRAWVGLTMFADGSRRWRLHEARAALADLWPLVSKLTEGDWTGWGLTGEVEARGAGGWTEDGPSGPIQLTLGQGEVTSADPAVQLSELEVAFELRQWPEPLHGEGALAFARATVAGIEAERGSAGLQLVEGKWTIGPAQMDALGGQLIVSPIVWTDDDEPVTFRVQLHNIAVSALAALAPQMFRAATGTVSGQIELRYSAAEGVVPIDGFLAVDAARSAEVTLAPQPGFLTRQLPRRYRWLPQWMGTLGDRLAPANPAYEMLEGIELGRVPLRVQRLEVRFFPPEDPEERTVQMVLEGRPIDGRVVESVSLQVNVTGPLADVIRLGLDDRAQISGGLR
jgi:hypothetical protein